MEMMTVKCEVMNIRKRCSSMVESENPEIKCVKRRRRVPIMKPQRKQEVDRSTADTTSTVKRSSKFRGVSRHRWTGRYEAHLWDKASWNVTQKKKGKQVYLGAYDEEESAARAYDLAALKYWGPTTFTNFPIAEYEAEINIMHNLTKEEYLASLRRKSSGFSRGVSKYRGVARHHQNGRWEARIGRVFGNKYLYLGTYSTQEEAARAYDIAAIEYRGVNAVTNFELSTYIRWLRPDSNAVLPSNDPQEIGTHEALPSTYKFIAKDEPELLLATSQLPIDGIGSPQTQEIVQRSLASSLCTPSSTTALSVLLRSSLFKELVEKNSSASDDETEDDCTSHHEEIGSNDDEYGGIFNEAIMDAPYLCSPHESILGFQLLENQSSFYDQTRQFLLNMC